MKWTTQPTMAFDTETGGTDVFNDRIVTAAIVMLAPKVAEPRIRSWLINPGPDIEIPIEATGIHGITTEQARREGMDPADALSEITDHLVWALSRDLPVVAFNAAFDLTITEAECGRHGVPTLEDRLGVDMVRPIIDPMVLDRRTFRKMDDAPTDEEPAARLCPCGCGATRKNLGMSCDHYGVELLEAHDAAADAIAADGLWRAIVAKNPGRFGRYTVTALHKAQITWRAEFMDFMRDRFDAEGKPHDGFNSEWPIQHHRAVPSSGSPEGLTVETVELQGALL